MDIAMIQVLGFGAACLVGGVGLGIIIASYMHEPRKRDARGRFAK